AAGVLLRRHQARQLHLRFSESGERGAHAVEVRAPDPGAGRHVLHRAGHEAVEQLDDLGFPCGIIDRWGQGLLPLELFEREGHLRRHYTEVSFTSTSLTWKWRRSTAWPA